MHRKRPSFLWEDEDNPQAMAMHQSALSPYGVRDPYAACSIFVKGSGRKWLSMAAMIIEPPTWVTNMSRRYILRWNPASDPQFLHLLQFFVCFHVPPSPGISTTSDGSGDGTPSTATVKGRTSYNSGLPCHNIPRPWLICCSRVRSSPPPSNPLRRRLFGVLETRAHRQQTIALSLKNVEFLCQPFMQKAQGFEVILSERNTGTSPSSGGTFALLAPLLGLLWLGWYAWFGGGTRTLGSPQRQQWQLSCTGRDFGDLSVSFEVADSRSCLKRQCSGPVVWWQFCLRLRQFGWKLDDVLIQLLFGMWRC